LPRGTENLICVCKFKRTDGQSDGRKRAACSYSNHPRSPALLERERTFSTMVISATSQAILDNWEKCDRLDTLFVIFCSTTCWLVVPAIGLAYSGYSIKGNGWVFHSDMGTVKSRSAPCTDWSTLLSSLASYFPSLLAMLCVSIQCECGGVQKRSLLDRCSLYHPSQSRVGHRVQPCFLGWERYHWRPDISLSSRCGI
jgi:hypothetical protein